MIQYIYMVGYHHVHFTFSLSMILYKYMIGYHYVLFTTHTKMKLTVISHVFVGEPLAASPTLNYLGNNICCLLGPLFYAAILVNLI